MRMSFFGKLTVGFFLFTLFFVASLVLFYYTCYQNDKNQVDLMNLQLPDVMELQEVLRRYPQLSTVSYTEDGRVTLYDTEQEAIGTFKVDGEGQKDVLRTVNSIYKDDDGIVFSYTQNQFSVSAQVIFPTIPIETQDRKNSNTETITKIENGVYTLVTDFDYMRFMSPEEIYSQLLNMYESLKQGLGELESYAA